MVAAVSLLFALGAAAAARARRFLHALSLDFAPQRLGAAQRKPLVTQTPCCCGTWSRETPLRGAQGRLPQRTVEVELAR